MSAYYILNAKNEPEKSSILEKVLENESTIRNIPENGGELPATNEAVKGDRDAMFQSDSDDSESKGDGIESSEGALENE